MFDLFAPALRKIKRVGSLVYFCVVFAEFIKMAAARKMPGFDAAENSLQGGPNQCGSHIYEFGVY